MAEKKLDFFNSLLAGYCGQGWPKISEEQKEFLFSQPKNKKGWNYYSVGGFTFHIKGGLDYRNPSVPYLLVKVNGKLVLKRLGVDGGSYIGKTERGQFYATKSSGCVGDLRRFVYYPIDGWEPHSEDADFYRSFFDSDFACCPRLSAEEKKVLWLASQYEDLSYLQRCIRSNEASVKREGGEYWTNLLESKIARYVRLIQSFRSAVENCIYGGIFYICN